MNVRLRLHRNAVRALLNGYSRDRLPIRQVHDQDRIVVPNGYQSEMVVGHRPNTRRRRLRNRHLHFDAPLDFHADNVANNRRLAVIVGVPKTIRNQPR